MGDRNFLDTTQISNFLIEKEITRYLGN